MSIVRLFGFALVGITIVGVSIGLTVVLNPAEETYHEIAGIEDSDHDGIPDDQDFFHGNGGVEVTIANFEGKENCKNVLPIFSPKCQPKFWIYIDTNGDGKFNDKNGKIDKSYTNENEIDDALTLKVDIPDDSSKVRFLVRIKDTDGDDWIDYWMEDGENYGYVEAGLKNLISEWTFSGNAEVRCDVTFRLEVVSMPIHP